MGILISVPIIAATSAINNLIELNHQINGKWFTYLCSLTQLWIRRRQNKTNRIMKHEVWTDEVTHSAIIPFEHEWDYDLPSKDKCEDVFIYGVNSSKESIKIAIKWRVSQKETRIERKASVNLRFDDSEGNYYTLEEESEVEYKKKEYKACGLALEILGPFRKRRIRFRGYLNKNGKQLVYVRFRFLWSSFSRVYDFTNDFDDQFMAKELSKCKAYQNEDVFEDRLGQFGQFKGTFTEEDRPERVLYFWGSTNKNFLPTKSINRRIIRVVGYTKEGIGFDFGLLSNNNGQEYRFGLLFEKAGALKKLQTITLAKSDFEQLLSESQNISFKGVFGEKEYEFQIKENKNSLANDLVVNGTLGMCYILEEIESESQDKVITIENIPRDMSLVLGLNEENAKSVHLTGGKGSSLAVLMSLSHQLVEEKYENTFNVANSVVVTTNAYQTLLEEYEDLKKEINSLERATDIPKDELKKKCQNLMNSISDHKLPEIIAKEMEKKLEQNFNNFENKLFAVRSSGASEDSEEMSAAGQMTTYLGVKGLEDIKQSVMKCWSSQFSHIAVDYKRNYGQPINSPMAVVIQEMVNCESAGVMFTCDPITGDERIIEITGNYGLGESVVSASSEPDTIRLSVNIESNSLSERRTIRKIEKKVIGAKKTLIKLSENGGTVEEEVIDRENCCIGDEELFLLGDLGLRVHKHYGNARDIEWGLKGGQIFMLQSRPVTNLDNSYTEYEIMHELDTPHITEFEIYSRAHWGENFPGSSSWMMFTYFWSNKQKIFRMLLAQGKITEEDYNPYGSPMGVQYNQFMFNLSSGFDFFNGYPEDGRAKNMVMAMFGHHITDQDVLNMFKQKRKEENKKMTFFAKIKFMAMIFYGLIFGPTNLFKAKKYYMEELKYDQVQMLKKCSDSKQMWQALLTDLYANDEALKNHMPVSMGSTIKNGLLESALAKAVENNPHLDDDFNLMTSSCSEVISAEVPNYLRDIAIAIKDKKEFTQLSDEKALKLLKDGSDEASNKFKEFLERHGHRGYRELDPMHPPWRDNPIPCIKNIKAMLSGKESQLIPKPEKSVNEVISELKTPLSFTRKLLISKLLLPWSRKAVGYRELSKYFMIWFFDKQRQGLRFLAKRMVTEGLIPSEDMFFYLTATEVHLLINGDRDPMINMRARLRKRVYPKMNKYKFEEFIKGPEMKPRNFEDQIIAPNLTEGMSVQMSGTPVSNGTVKARVCVAEDITEADNIQSGDILITYSTDIGWSPYFTLLSGIITEIGGTISHGAVIAREYGIPCLVAVDGACRTFKTGDICILDTKSATITRIT